MKLSQIFTISLLLIVFFISSCKKSPSNTLPGEILPFNFNRVNVPDNYVGKWKLFQRSVNSQVPGLKGEVLQGDKLGFTQTIELRSDSSFTKIITGTNAQAVNGTYKIVTWGGFAGISLTYPEGTSWKVIQSCGSGEGLSFSSNGMLYSNGWAACDGPYAYVYIKDK